MVNATFCSKYSSSRTDSDKKVSRTESLFARRHLIMAAAARQH